MNIWLLAVSVSSGLGSIIAVLFAICKIKKELVKSADAYICKRVDDELKPLIDISMAQIRYSIVRAHREYMKIGVIGAHDLEALEDMYKQYVDNHRNGFLSKIMSDIEDLPTVSENLGVQRRENI